MRIRRLTMPDGGTSFETANESYEVTDANQKEYSVINDIQTGSAEVMLNGMDQYEGLQFDLSGKTIIFKPDFILYVGDLISVKYYY